MAAISIQHQASMAVQFKVVHETIGVLRPLGSSRSWDWIAGVHFDITTEYQMGLVWELNKSCISDSEGTARMQEDI